MAEIRRKERKNETIVLGKLDEIFLQLGNFSTAIALIQAALEAINVHLSQLNGKVIAHENRLNDQAIINTKITATLDALTNKIVGDEKIDANRNGKNSELLTWAAKAAIGVVALLFYTTLVKSGVISNFLN